jgi:hypothetical protein
LLIDAQILQFLIATHLVHVLEVTLDPGPWSWLICSPPGTHAKYSINFPESNDEFLRRNASDAVRKFPKEMEKLREKLMTEISGFLITFRTFLNIPISSISVSILMAVDYKRIHLSDLYYS